MCLPEGDNHGRVFSRTMVFYEGAKEILDATHCHLLASIGQPDCFDLRFCRSAVYLYTFLGSTPVVGPLMRHMTAPDVAPACAYATDKKFIFAPSLFWLNRRNLCSKKLPGAFPVPKRHHPDRQWKKPYWRGILTGSFIERGS